MGDQNTGNYFKLVLDIGNEQTEAGAGGAWGIGKSLYFRLGEKGFVIYYSRISTAKGKYESRLIAMMVENERLADFVIPPASFGMSKTGIAYWGVVENNNVLPITNEDEIKHILDIFHIKQYEGTETGTAVILPFINEEELLSDNQKIYEEGKEEITPYWRNSINEFIKISIQRWYFARLNNKKYRYGNYLSASVNCEKLELSKMAPCFKVFQALYNRAAGKKEEELFDVLSNNEDVKVEDVSLARYKPLARKKVGTLAYIIADKDLLEMTHPNNNCSPYVYCDTDIQDFDTNTPIIGYCRKPGMIVNFETSGDWLYKVPNTDNEHFLMAIFVLNSTNSLGEDYDLEEYVRKMEPNDHMEWVDGTFNGANYTFIRGIKSTVSKILFNLLSKDDSIDSKRKISELGKIYSWILPPEDFGKKAKPRQTSPKGPSESFGRTHKKIKYALLSQELSTDKVVLTYNFEASQKKADFGVKLLVSTSDGKNISLEEWNKMGAAIPFYIQCAQVSLKKIDGKVCSKMYPLSEVKSSYDDSQVGMHLELRKLTFAPIPFLLNIQFDTEHIFTIDIRLTVHISSRNAIPTINIV